jgi:hypothetical protein
MKLVKIAAGGMAKVTIADVVQSNGRDPRRRQGAAAEVGLLSRDEPGVRRSAADRLSGRA